MKITRGLPPNSFVGRYLQYMAVQETPEVYDFWTAMWLLSVALGRSIVVDRPRAPVFLNWFIILVAESGTTRKSTSVRHATRIAHHVVKDEQCAQLITTKVTPEAIEEIMNSLTREHGSASLAISISELVTFLGKEKYAKHLPGLLTDLYDSPDFRASPGSITRGEKVIKNAYVTFLSASTPAWLLRAINPDVIEGGFTSRTLFIVSEKRKRRVAWPEGEGGFNVEQFALDLTKIREKARDLGKIEISKGGLDRFVRWYNKRPEHRDPFRASFESREDSHVLRLAAMFAINEDIWEIQDRHIALAIPIIAGVKEDGAAIFESGLTNNKLALGIDKLREKLIEAGINGIGHRDLYLKVRNFLSNEDFRYSIEILHELEMLQIFEPVDGRQKLYRATNRITGRQTVDLVLNRLDPAR